MIMLYFALVLHDFLFLYLLKKLSMELKFCVLVSRHVIYMYAKFQNFQKLLSMFF
jgi:hypothetical protein